MRDQNIKASTRVTILLRPERKTETLRDKATTAATLQNHNIQYLKDTKKFQQDFKMAPSKQKLLVAYKLYLSQQENGGQHQVALDEKPVFANLPLPIPSQERIIANPRIVGELTRESPDSCWDCNAANHGNVYRDLMHSPQSSNPAFATQDIGQVSDYETSYKANSSLLHHIPMDDDFRKLLTAEHHLIDADVSVATLYWSEAEIRYMSHRNYN